MKPLTTVLTAPPPIFLIVSGIRAVRQACSDSTYWRERVGDILTFRFDENIVEASGVAVRVSKIDGRNRCVWRMLCNRYL